MLKPRRTRQFKKDWRRMKRRGRNMEEIQSIIRSLMCEEELEENRRPHPLRGEWEGCMECHVGGDWLLIWQTTDTYITFIRTGTHADIFE